MTTTAVSQVLKEKGNQVWTTSPDTTVYQALKLMADKNIGALVVLDKGKMVGIFTERDYARKVILRGKSSMEMPIKEIMTHKVYCIPPTRTVEESMALMTAKRVRHLPVLDENEALIGVVSIGDVVKRVIDNQEFTIQQLDNYIMGI